MTTDLRLAPAALVAWAVAWWAVARDGPGRVALGAAVLLVTALAAGVGPRRFPAPAPARDPRGGTGDGARAGRVTVSVAFALAVGATVLAVTACQLAVRDASGLRAGAAAGRVVTVDAVVRDDPTPIASPWGGDPLVLVLVDARTVTLDGDTRRAAAPVLVRGDGAWADARVGERVRVTGSLAPAEAGERAVAVLRPTGGRVTVHGATGPLRVVDDLRAGLVTVTDDLSTQARALVPGVAVGDVTRLDPDLADAMKTSGLTHVTAVSGGHFAIVAAVLAGLCGVARLGRWARLAVLGPCLSGFVLLVRPDPSVVRSAAMCGVTLVALCLGRPARSVPSLCAGSVVLLLADPWLARSYGFVLSASATAGIVLGTGPLARRLESGMPRLFPRPVALAVAVPCAAQAACGPVLVLLAPTLPVYAVPANLVAEPALVPATLLGVAATLVAPWWGAGAHAIAWCAGLATWWVAQVATVASQLPGARAPWLPGLPGAALLAGVTVVVAAAAVLSPWAGRGRLAGCLPLLGPTVPPDPLPVPAREAGHRPGWRSPTSPSPP
ncbi:ComEC/Rec2 family competence protein [Luteimicrobium subarcticum]|uniref:Competence protein ComEC n=1 Tax=Luteimicrobium subarcticum TaxID=620910 RepID=A0A2M8WQX8_9MICO|nr:ComEC/Rec2 family competence protein [Luteimicrobium subarcticum]PJI93342.1 competence protein ComEC [Luteimicrobium subarcticum]